MGRVTRTHPLLHVSVRGSDPPHPPSSVRGSDVPEPVSRRIDQLAVEEPLEIRVNGSAYQVTMRTPGDDIDLVHGLLLSESVIAHRTDVSTVRYCAGSGPDGNSYNVLDVRLAAHLLPPLPELQRNVVTSSACGICGTTSIDQVVRESRFELAADLVVPPELVVSAPDLLRTRQRAFAKTGGLHAAGLLTSDGAMVCVREDVGRHNAVDKVIGWAIREDRLPLSRVILVVSGRASFELTQKAVLAGIPMLAAVSAPSSLAVELADAAGLTLVGFVRDETMNVYTHPERVKLTGSGT
jgi:FdhD protein